MGLKPHKPSDYPSFLLYVLDETHLSVTVLTASFILYTRSAHSAYFALGALASSFAAKLIKKCIRSPRPPPPPPSTAAGAAGAAADSATRDGRGKTRTSRPPTTTHIRPKKTYGMPSTHSTALTFYLAYILPLLAHPSHASLADPARRGLVALAVAGYWAGGVWSRVELGYHTYAQCLGGVALGSIFAVGWRVLWETHPGWEGPLQTLVDTVWSLTLGKVL